MKIIKEKLLSNSTPPIAASLTLGMFDGVHRGHLSVLHQLKKLAHESHSKSVVISFEEHPAKALRGVEEDFVLNTHEEKHQLLEKTGCVDILLLLETTPYLLGLEAKKFLEEKIYPHFEIKNFLLGHDSKFGKNRSGDIQLLKEEGKHQQFRVIESEIIFGEYRKKISSTQIRNHLKEQNIEEANDMLGYAYKLEGKVVRGDQRGRTIGFPTANIDISDHRKLIPSNGVYFVYAKINGGKYNNEKLFGIMNIGFRPTFKDEKKRVIEVHILEFEDNIYDHSLEVEVLGFIRSEQKFDSVDHLIQQLGKDKKEAQNFFKK